MDQISVYQDVSRNKNGKRISFPYRILFDKLYMIEQVAYIRYGYSRDWFRRKRLEGGGPSFLKRGKKRGKFLYPLEETDAWFSDHELAKSRAIKEK